MSDRPFRAAKCGGWRATPSEPEDITEQICGEPMLYIESDRTNRSKYRESEARDLHALLEHALASVPQAPPDDDLVPILDAVRERRFGDAIRAIVLNHYDEHTAEVVGALYTACVERFPEECAVIATDTVSVQRAGYMPCGECEGQTVLVTCGSESWRQCLEQCSRTSRRQPAIGGINDPTRYAQPETEALNDRGQSDNRTRQEAARNSGNNCQSCDGGYIRVRRSGAPHLRRCSRCNGRGIL